MQEILDDIVREVAELPDRSSPADWPDAMLVTGEELREIVLRHTGGRIMELERIVAWLIRGVQCVLEHLDQHGLEGDEEGNGLDAQLRSHCLGTLTADDGKPLPPKFEEALARLDAEQAAL